MSIMARDEASAPTLGRTRLIAACTIGNALEFYDFVIYSFRRPVFPG